MVRASQEAKRKKEQTKTKAVGGPPTALLEAEQSKEVLFQLPLQLLLLVHVLGPFTDDHVLPATVILTHLPSSTVSNKF